MSVFDIINAGEVAERLNAPVSKTGTDHAATRVYDTAHPNRIPLAGGGVVPGPPEPARVVASWRTLDPLRRDLVAQVAPDLAARLKDLAAATDTVCS